MRSERAILVLLLGAVAGWFAVSLLANGERDSATWSHYCAVADSSLSPRRQAARRGVWQANTHLENYKPYVVDINRADSAALVRVYGIGPVFASRILARRAALGGFHSAEQLKEVRGITEEVFLRVAKSFSLDSGAITKININFAPLNVLRAHPYFSTSMVRRIEAERMKGGFFRNHKELTDKDILLPKEARRVAPYLSFD